MLVKSHFRPDERMQRSTVFSAATCIKDPVRTVKGVFEERRLCTNGWQLQPNVLFEVESLQTKSTYCNIIQMNSIAELLNKLVLFDFFFNLTDVQTKNSHLKDDVV